MSSVVKQTWDQGVPPTATGTDVHPKFANVDSAIGSTPGLLYGTVFALRCGQNSSRRVCYGSHTTWQASGANIALVEQLW